jgi:glycosyltransferase involved in cell wall biosynthesis
MKKLSLVRGNRISVIDFYKNFKQFDIKFLSGNTSPLNPTELQLPDSMKLINLKLRNAFFIDPVEALTNNINNLSWKFFNDMERHLENANLIGITDTYYFWNYQAADFAHQHDIPLYTVIWCNIPHHITSIVPPYSVITQKVIESTQLFILRNEKAREFTHSLQIPESKIKVIHKGIDLQKFNPGEEKEEREQINILYVGALTKAKGVDALLKAFLKLESKYPISLTIAGNGSLNEEIQKLARSHKINFYHSVPYNELPLLYCNADIFCSPSRIHKIAGITIWQEYFSYTLMEAQAAGLPIITTPTGGILEEVDQRNYFVQDIDSVQLEKSMEQLILNKSERKSLGQINRQRAEKQYDSKIQAALTEEALLKIV